MPMNVFVSISRNTENKRDTSLFLQKPNLRTNFKESDFEETLT